MALPSTSLHITNGELNAKQTLEDATTTLAKYRSAPSVASVVSCAFATTGFALFIISALAVIGPITSSSILGNA